ncbi:MAG: ABC transporter substrate-binding protein [Gammaproteobacteria bacterium]|nr:ABC transporter substrate-binding protein [Gammaproteobacteria bacterium]
MKSLLALITVGLMVVAPFTAGQAEEPTVKLGALYNLTGGMSPIDAPAWRGSQLAATRVNARGGVLNGRKLELLVIDTRTEVPVIQEAAAQLAAKPVAAGLGYNDSDSVLAAAPMFQKHNIPFLTTGATDPELPKKIGRLMFMTPFGDNDQAYAMADFAYKTLNARNVVVWINESTDFTRVLAQFFKEHYLKLGGKIVGEHSFAADQREFSAAVENLKKLSPQPDAVFISGNPEDAAPTVQQLREAGIHLPILSGDGFDADLLTLLPKPADAEGVYFATHAFFASKRPEVVDFVTAYREEYGKAPENSFAALGYDAVNLLADAIDRAGSAESEAIAKALGETRDFKAVTGNLSFTRPSRVPVVPVEIMAIKDQQYQLMTTWIP